MPKDQIASRQSLSGASHFVREMGSTASGKKVCNRERKASNPKTKKAAIAPQQRKDARRKEEHLAKEAVAKMSGSL